jgi:hypothetical protein
MAVRFDNTSRWRDRIIGLFRKHPNEEFPWLQLQTRLTEGGKSINAGTLRYHLNELLDEAFVIKPRHGFYMLNPDQLKTRDVHTVEEQRSMLADHLSAGAGVQVVKGDGFHPLKPPITVSDGPRLAAQKERFASVLERMAANPNIFTRPDVDLILAAVPPEWKPEPAAT